MSGDKKEKDEVAEIGRVDAEGEREERLGIRASILSFTKSETKFQFAPWVSG